MKFSILPVLLGATQLHGITGSLFQSFYRSLQGQGSALGDPGQGQGNQRPLPCTIENLPKHPPGAPTKTVLKFAAFGDIPYEESERYCLNQQLRDLDLNTPGGPKFAVHVGDIKWGKDECTEASYSDIAQIFDHPSNKLSYDTRDIFFVVGDNEWMDCRDDRDLAWARYMHYFGPGGPQNFGMGSPSKRFGIHRQTTAFHMDMPAYNRGENFCFLDANVLVCGVNIIGGNKIYGDEELRLPQNLEWIESQMEKHSSEVKALVMMAHADMKSVRENLWGSPVQSFLRNNYHALPVLYIHGNGHDFCVYGADPENENFTAVEVEAGAYAPPMIVSVVENTDDGTYLFEIDRQGGLYDPPGACPAAMEKTWAPHEPKVLRIEGELPGSDESAPDIADAPTPTPTSQPTKSPIDSPRTGPPTPSPSSTATSLPTSSASEAKGTGHPCDSSRECNSNTCRDGVCMATSACYPLKHKFGDPFFENKVNIVFVASGFDTATKEEWQAHVNRAYVSFENYTMFSNTVEQLNMFRVDPRKLDASYCSPDCAGITKLLCCDQNRALRLAQMCVPIGSNLQTVVIHNDERFGSAGYLIDNIATVSTHPKALVAAIHVLVRSLFHLGDEYTHGSGTAADPNCDSTSSCDKWSDLIGNTPAGYAPVQCLPGCQNDAFYVGAKSFMNDVNSPMGAVNERLTCCTYLALTKSLPLYCDVLNLSPNNLTNWCKNNDYQQYGSASYDSKPRLSISDGSTEDTNYVYVESPVFVAISTKEKKNTGDIVYRPKQSPLDAGVFLSSRLKGDFSSPRMALEHGFVSVLKMRILYQTDKQIMFLSPNTTIEVPISEYPADGDEPRVVSEQTGIVNAIVDTQGKAIKKIRINLLTIG